MRKSSFSSLSREKSFWININKFEKLWVRGLLETIGQSFKVQFLKLLKKLIYFTFNINNKIGLPVLVIIIGLNLILGKHLKNYTLRQ